MKHRALNIFIVPALLALSLFIHPCSTAFAQGTAFTYQGQLQNNGSPANGTYNLQFSLYTNVVGGTAVAGPFSTNDVVVANGLFTATVDFGSSVWNGATNWLEIGVEANGGNSFTTLTPRQQLTSTPYAIYAKNANLAGTYGNTVDFDNGADSFDGSFYGDFYGSSFIGGNFVGDFIGNGAGLTGVNASSFSGTLNNNQLANSSITVTAGTGLSGGGTIALGGSTMLNNAGVTSLTGSDGVTVSAASGSVTLGLGGTLSLPSQYVTVYAGGTVLLHSDGSANMAEGLYALGENENGMENTAYGAYALNFNPDGSYNTAIGYGALEELGAFQTLGGTNNIALGFNAGTAFTGNESFNIDIGNAGVAGENGIIRIGTPGIQTATYLTGTLNLPAVPTAIYAGTTLLLYAGANGNFFAGTNAGNLTMSGGENTAVGDSALNHNTTGLFNTGSGVAALFNNTSGSYNTAHGFAALYNNTSGTFNTADGYAALDASTNGSENTAIGADALLDNWNGSQNTAIGASALYQLGTLSGAGGTNNIALGFNAGTAFTGNESSNIDIGNVGVVGENDIIRIGQTNIHTATYLAGAVHTDGGVNVDENDENSGTISARALTFGYNSGEGIGSQRTTGSSQYSLDFYTGFAQRMIILANGDVGIGTASPDNALSVNGSADKPGGGSWGTFSDARLKDVGAQFTRGLEALDGIQPVQYHYKAGNPLDFNSASEYIGVVAQQVQQAIPEAVQHSKSGYLIVNNDPIIWTMVNSIKELEAENETLKDNLNQKLELQTKEKDSEIADLKRQNDSLSERLGQLEQTVKKLTGEN